MSKSNSNHLQHKADLQADLQPPGPPHPGKAPIARATGKKAGPLTPKYGSIARNAKPPVKKRQLSRSCSPTVGRRGVGDLKKSPSLKSIESCPQEGRSSQEGPSNGDSKVVPSSPSTSTPPFSLEPIVPVEPQQQNDTAFNMDVELPSEIEVPAATNMTVEPKSVSFNDFSELFSIEPYSQAELKLKWYTQRDRERSMLNLRADAQRVAALMAATPAHVLAQDENMMYESVGMESFLSRSVFMRTIHQKRNHARTILGAQARQRRCNLNDMEEMRQFSERSSAWSRDRASSIAGRYW